MHKQTNLHPHRHTQMHIHIQPHTQIFSHINLHTYSRGFSDAETCKYTHRSIQTLIYRRIYMYMYTHTHSYIFIYVCMCVCVRVNIHIYTPICVYVCVCECMNINVYMYIIAYVYTEEYTEIRRGELTCLSKFWNRMSKLNDFNLRMASNTKMIKSSRFFEVFPLFSWYIFYLDVRNVFFSFLPFVRSILNCIRLAFFFPFFYVRCVNALSILSKGQLSKSQNPKPSLTNRQEGIDFYECYYKAWINWFYRSPEIELENGAALIL